MFSIFRKSRMCFFFFLPTKSLKKPKPVLLKSSVLTPLAFLCMLNSAILQSLQPRLLAVTTFATLISCFFSSRTKFWTNFQSKISAFYQGYKRPHGSFLYASNCLFLYQQKQILNNFAINRKKVKERYLLNHSAYFFFPSQ